MNEDIQFLIWLHRQMTDVYGESPIAGRMHSLRRIIYGYPRDHEASHHYPPMTDIDDLIEELNKEIKQYE